MIMMNSLPEKIGERPNHSGWRGVKMAMKQRKESATGVERVNAVQI